MTAHQITSNRATIIMPAHNEEAIIRNTLQELCRAQRAAEFQVIVVCNGCTDKTEQIVLNEFPTVHCASLKQASKALAIRFAESLNPGFPRIYLDADIGLSASDADQLIAISKSVVTPQLLVPRSELICHDSSTLVKSFYRAWYATPHVQKNGYGAGVYVLNESGRRRFNKWPELIADDAFVRSYFSIEETCISDNVTVHVKAPKTLWSLLKIKTRSKYGNLELKKHFNQLLKNEQKKQTWSNMSAISARDRLTYYLVNAVALMWAKWQYLRGVRTWHRDNSHR